MSIRIILSAFIFIAILSVRGEDGVLSSDGHPEVVNVGAGSYASRPPRDQNKRPWLQGQFGWGDDSQLYSRMPLYVSPENLTGKTKRPIPSTDWWTSLVSMRWSGQLWMYPSVIKATPCGVEFSTPRKWLIEGGGRSAVMTSSVKLLVGADGFTPLHAEAVDWSDWMVLGRLPDSQGRSIEFTAAHGVVCTVFEYKGELTPIISLASGEAAAFKNESKSDPLNPEMFGLESEDGYFGIYAPAGSMMEYKAGSLRVKFPSGAGKRFVSIAPLNSKEDLLRFAPYASVLPRSTEVSWNYVPEKGVVNTHWKIRSEDLSGQGRTAVLQGWLPHHYNTPSAADFTPSLASYPSPRGELRCEAGTSFNIAFPFRGLLPTYPRPDEKTPGEPFNPALMKELIESHLDSPDYGTETYWGGKKVLHFGRYMELARQFGLKDASEVYRDRAVGAVRDWLTYTPGEGEHFFAWYPRWGSFVGCRSRDNANPGVDILQDHHMCYGYHVYCAALVFFHDKKFAEAYGPMARLVAKDYAEWDEKSKLFCRFRNLDPWSGHSWSGGLGAEQGNGQESSSEAMQGYGAMFLLGEALNDKEMRDAAAFCWAMESRGIMEYYFDRSGRNFPSEWPHTMNTNVHTDGIGFWTWFSNNPMWMHAIQWLPMSPLLSYLFEDRAYAEADFKQMWKTHEGGKGWEGYLGSDSGVSNIALNYLAGFDAEQAAKVFRVLTEQKRGGVKGSEAAHTYWRIHALKRLGPHRFDAWTDTPLSQAFGVDAKPENISWAVFNHGDAPRKVNCFIDGVKTAEFTAKARSFSVMKNGKVTVEPISISPVFGGYKTDSEEISLGCPVTASSERGGNKAENVLDGNMGTRWESEHTDNEWLMIDFQGECSLKSISLLWEAAFASDYEIELSNDAETWRSVKSVRNGKGGAESYPLSGKASFLRIRSLKRGTSWGTSLYSISIYGKNESGKRLKIKPETALLNELDKVKFNAFFVDKDGKESPAENVIWQVVQNQYSGGRIDSKGVFTPRGAGNFAQPRGRLRRAPKGLWQMLMPWWKRLCV